MLEEQHTQRICTPAWSAQAVTTNKRAVDKHAARVLTLLLLALGWGASVGAASAQRPFVVHDPFYRNETAQRAFYDGFALSGEVAYRPAGALQEERGLSLGIDPLGFSFRFDYELASSLDLSVLLDATGGRTERTLTMSWVVLTYYEYADGADHSLRLAVDPRPDGLTGFPQTDVAFVTSVPMSLRVATDIALGARRVRTGYEQWVRMDETAASASPAASAVTMAAAGLPPGVEAVYTHVLGWEAHMMNSYKWQLDPAGSNVFFTMLAEAGEYKLLETAPEDAPEVATERSEPRLTTAYQAGVFWLRSGFEYSRPGYQIAPFVSIPVGQWASEDDEALRARLNAGLRLMIR